MMNSHAKPHTYLPSSKEYEALHSKLKENKLITVCEQAACPNIGECWDNKTATFLILGSICTRGCAFCNITKGTPLQPDPKEPQRIAKTVKQLGLKHVVITSVNRDDLPFEGAEQFIKTIRELRKKTTCTIELLIPDFNTSNLKAIVTERPDIIGHNIELPEKQFKKFRVGNYNHSIAILKKIQEINPSVTTKTSFMVGLGETMVDIKHLLLELRKTHVNILTVGQYLQPSHNNPQVEKYYSEMDFSCIQELALKAGIGIVVAGRLVRSSYKAKETFYKSRKI